ncbi:protein lin-37 homolog [Manduca sexta]|uniref:protein lin-37 homolog n=1 Tax=Manduca sexta TaxID=7130 RepID=UPI001182D9AD|nr:protein lin-37 homolog [Manduca sexta]
MPKRRRLFTPLRHRKSQNIISKNDYDERTKEVSTARGRLQGALMEVLDPAGEESDVSSDQSPPKRSRHSGNDLRNYFSDDEDRYMSRRPPRQSYVLKLFDRSVDLSQFSEDSPLYPICRAWIANQPKADYKKFGKTYAAPEQNENTVELPGPEGPTVSRIPELLPEQKAANKDNINLNYREAPPPTREQLLQSHTARWTAVRAAWVAQSNKAEMRYEATQQLLNRINVNNI